MEFGAKYDVSADEKGHARLERMDFDAYNECGVFKDAVERYKARTGHYPARALIDRIYRTKVSRKTPFNQQTLSIGRFRDDVPESCRMPCRRHP